MTLGESVGDLKLRAADAPSVVVTWANFTLMAYEVAPTATRKPCTARRNRRRLLMGAPNGALEVVA